MGTKELELCDAVYKQDMAGAKKCLDDGANPNCFDSEEKGSASPLWYAAINGQDAMIRLLLDRGANVNLRGQDGDYALHAAASGGQMSSIKMLIGAGADLKLLNDEGEDAAECARNSGWDEAADYLDSQKKK